MSFAETFEQVGALYRNASGKGWHGTLLRDLRQGEMILLFENNFRQRGSQDSAYHIFAKRIVPLPPPSDDEKEVPF